MTCLGFQKRFVYKWQIIKTNLIFATGLLFQPFFFSFSRISFPTTSFHQYLSFSSTGAIRDGATLAIFCSYNLQISHKHLTCKTPTVLEATNTHMHVHALPHTHTQYIILVLITKTTTLWVSFSIFLHLFLNSTLRVWTFGNVQRFHYSATASFDWSVCLQRQKKIFIDATIKLTPLFKAAIPGDLDTPTKRPSLCHVNEQTTLSQPATWS